MESVKNQSRKADAGKTDPTLLQVDCAAALAVTGFILDYGVKKYKARGGWKKVEPERYDAAKRRHVQEHDLGQKFDDESQALHRAHEACNVLFLLQMELERIAEETGWNMPQVVHSLRRAMSDPSDLLPATNDNHDNVPEDATEVPPMLPRTYCDSSCRWFCLDRCRAESSI